MTFRPLLSLWVPVFHPADPPLPLQRTCSGSGPSPGKVADINNGKPTCGGALPGMVLLYR